MTDASGAEGLAARRRAGARLPTSREAAPPRRPPRATTPNVESWRSILSLVFRGHFIAFTDRDYPAHVTALTRRDLVRVLTEAGFAPPAFFFTDRGVLPRATFTTWQAISFGRLRGVRFSDNVGVVARKGRGR